MPDAIVDFIFLWAGLVLAMTAGLGILALLEEIGRIALRAWRWLNG